MAEVRKDRVTRCCAGLALPPEREVMLVPQNSTPKLGLTGSA
jgi:hypothetical protein